MSLDKLRAGLRAHRYAIATVLVASLFALAWFFSGNELGVMVVQPQTNVQASSAAPAGLPPTGSAGALALVPEGLTREQTLQLFQQRLALAEHSLSSYRASTVYPRQSRPLKEHPDQIYLNQPIESEHVLRKTDGTFAPDVKVKTTQSHVFIGSKESVVFSLTAVDKAGEKLPIFITRALAKGVVEKGVRDTAQWTLNFADDGRAGDAQAGDGVFSAELAPALTGLSEFSGTIRTQVSFTVGDQNAFVSFDIVYTPSVPAVWLGAVRDALEAGSLNFYLRANVYQAGRYLVSARLDDAAGKPFALLSFNDELAAGQQEVKLMVFGKLLHDYAPSMPLVLRDVDAYLLKVGSDPDRALMPRLVGAVHTSKRYLLSSFSSAEANSEERTRYLLELNADVQRAKAALEALQAQ